MADVSNASTHMNVYCIEPLIGAENYAIWNIKMIDILMGQDLWEYVNGSTTQLTEEAQLPAWCKKNRMALSMICLWVADKMLVYIASSTSAKDAWDMYVEIIIRDSGGTGNCLGMVEIV